MNKKRTPTKTTTPKGARKTAQLPMLAWTTEIAHTRHRWWWYVVISWAGLTFSLFAATEGAWDIAAIVLVGAIGLIVINVGKPRIWKVTIDKTTIHIARPRHERFRYERPIDRYRAFTVVDMPAGKRDQPQRAIALLDRKKLGRAQLLVLPIDEHEADMLIQQFTDYLPYEADAAFSRGDRVVMLFASWLGVS